MHGQHHPGDAGAAGAPGQTPARELQLPQLRLPTFSVRPTQAPPRADAAPAPPAHLQHHPPQPQAAHWPNPYTQPAVAQRQHHVPAPVQTQAFAHGHAPAPFAPGMAGPAAAPRMVPQQPQLPAHAAPARHVAHHACHAPAPAPAPAPRPVRMAAPAPRPVPAFAGAAITTPANSFGGFDDSGTARFTTVHAGILLGLVVLAFLIARGAPGGSLSAATPARLPAAASPADAQQLPMKRDQAGIPSAASAASVASERSGTARRGGGAGSGFDTAKVKLKGIPSPAAAASIAPETLPMHRASDGVSLPRAAGERDGHAVDSHWRTGGGTDTLAMERPVARPAVTPGQAAQEAQVYSNLQVVGDGSYAPVPAGANVAY